MKHHIYIYIYMEENYGNKFDSTKKIEKQRIPNVMNLLWSESQRWNVSVLTLTLPS